MVAIGIGAECSFGGHLQSLCRTSCQGYLVDLIGVDALVLRRQDVEDLWGRSIDAARRMGIVQAGDRIVITAGTAVSVPGTTNVIKVETA